MSRWRVAAYNLTEREIRWAIENSHSNQEAAQMLNVSYAIFRKYASQYYDTALGKNLFEILNQKRIRTVKRISPENLVEDILNGKKQWMPKAKVERILIENCAFVEQCTYCGESERRVTDNRSCCMLVWKDGNYNNHHRDNLEMVCFNHFFLYYGDLKTWGYYRPHYDLIKAEQRRKNDTNKEQSE